MIQALGLCVRGKFFRRAQRVFQGGELLPVGEAHAEIHILRRTLRRQMPNMFQQQITRQRAHDKEGNALRDHDARHLL